MCFSQLSGEFIAYVVTRLYGFRVRLVYSHEENVRAEVEVALTERLFARWAICDALVCGLQWFLSV